MSVQEEVRFCDKCCRAFDVPCDSRTVVCDECKREWRRRYQAEYRRAPESQRREYNTARKARWRARTGRH